MGRVPLVTAVVALALAAGLSACSNDDDAAAPTAAAPAGAGQGATKKPSVDACTLLKADEIQNIIGANDGGGPGGGVGESTCAWENQENYHSVTLAIGSPGTTVDGNLPENEIEGPYDKGPDGIGFSSDNRANFVIGDRVSYLQVVTDPTSNKDRDTAVRLVRLVRSRFQG
jgi:hypothetical protein